MKAIKRYARPMLIVLLLVLLFTIPAMATSGNVAGAVQQTWKDAATQIKTVVDSVVFPALTMILAIAFFVKLGLSYFEFRKHGQFEWSATRS